MISADLTGNLGNHMFQYAITRSVAEHNGYRWGFNSTVSNDYYAGKPQMDFMEIDYGETHTAKWKEMPKGIADIWNEKYEHFDTHDFYYFQPDIFDIKDNTKLVAPCAQDARYYDREKLRKWFTIKKECSSYYNLILNNKDIKFNANTTIINVRGGEYKGVSSLILDIKYWQFAINHMIERNSTTNFIAITDDVEYTKSIMPSDMNIPVFHFGIGMDYYMINQARNLILSNSSFAIFPAWLNRHNPYVVAPRYWARHNISTGYWANSDIWAFGWEFMDREGVIHGK